MPTATAIDLPELGRIGVGRPAATRNPHFAQGRYQEAARRALAPRGFKKQEIKLADLSDGSAGATLAAWVKGIYAVPIGEDGRTRFRTPVYHVPSGLALGDVETPTRAKQVAMSLHVRRIDLAAMIDAGEYYRARRIVWALAPRI